MKQPSTDPPSPTRSAYPYPSPLPPATANSLPSPPSNAVPTGKTADHNFSHLERQNITRFSRLLWVTAAENAPNYAGISRCSTYYSTVPITHHATSLSAIAADFMPGKFIRKVFDSPSRKSRQYMGKHSLRAAS